jgi:hypothetical protein
MFLLFRVVEDILSLEGSGLASNAISFYNPQQYNSIRSEVFTMVNIHNVIFWVMTVCMNINNLEEHIAPNYSSRQKENKQEPFHGPKEE